MDTLYCENDGCRVVLFTMEDGPHTHTNGNCPGCGQFGRKKGK